MSIGRVPEPESEPIPAHGPDNGDEIKEVKQDA